MGGPLFGQCLPIFRDALDRGNGPVPFVAVCIFSSARAYFHRPKSLPTSPAPLIEPRSPQIFAKLQNDQCHRLWLYLRLIFVKVLGHIFRFPSVFCVDSVIIRPKIPLGSDTPRRRRRRLWEMHFARGTMADGRHLLDEHGGEFWGFKIGTCLKT